MHRLERLADSLRLTGDRTKRNFEDIEDRSPAELPIRCVQEQVYAVVAGSGA